MNIRPKTVRRLSILFAAFVLVAGAITAWLLLSLRHENAHIAELRGQAVAAFQAKDYAKASALFSDYLSRNHNQDTDAEADFEYGVSRARCGSLYEAINVFQHYLALRPNDPHDANHELLKLYTQARYNKETRTLADKLLKINPKDADALRSLVRAWFNDGEYANALNACRRLNQLRPEDLAWQRQELELMDKARATPAEIVAHAKQLQQQHPDDPRFGALLSVAQDRYAHDTAAAKLSIEAAAKLPPPDASAVVQMVALLDRHADFRLADDLLSRAMTSEPGHPELLRTLVGRTWERQRPADVVKLTDKIDPQSSSTAAAVLGYKAAALYELSRSDDAAALVKVLAGRKDDVSQAWATALRTRYGSPSITLAEAIKKYKAAIAADPLNAAFRSMLAEAYAREGATDLAVHQWVDAGALSPSWALPYCLISRTLCAMGRYSEALHAADIARQRAPGSQPVETAYALAWYGIDTSQQQAHTGSETSLLSLVEQIQKAWKNEPTTLPIYVSLLCRNGQQDRAADVVRDALATQPPCPADTLVKLAVVFDQEHLGPGTEVLDLAEKLHGPNPEIALARADSLARRGRIPDALRSIESAAKDHPADVGWQLANLQFRQQAGDADIAAGWSRLGDAQPNDLHVQRAILSSPARLTDHTLWRTAIDRYKAITGPDDPLWQVEDARLQLSGQPSEKDLETIVASLEQILRDSPGMAEAHKLLADALERTTLPDRTSRAIRELTAVRDASPQDLDATAALAQLLVGEGSQQKGISLVDQVAAQPGLSRDRRLWAARMYEALGRPDAALKLLTSNDTTSMPDPVHDGLLAAAYRQAGNSSQAADVYRRILDEPNASADVLATAAEFFTLRNENGLSERSLDRLAKLPLKPGTIEIIRAHLLELRGQSQQAVDTLAAAARAHPESEQVWQELSGSYLRRGQLDLADKTAAKGLKSVPSSPPLSAMRTQIAHLRTLTPQEVGPLLETISHEPQQPVASQAIQTLSEAKARKDSLNTVLGSLRQLADAHADFLPLQELLAERYAQSGRLKEAADVARRASDAAPNSPDPLRLLCSIQTAAGNYDAARETALRWKQRASDSVHPDLAIAAIDLQQSNADPNAALKQLSPHEAPDAPTATRDAALPLYCRALIMVGRPDDAAALMEPRLKSELRWRLVWMDLATAHKDATAASAWLQRLVHSISTESVTEKLALADAWEQIGSKFDSTQANESARDVLKPLVASEPVQPQAWAAWANVNQALSNLPEAERGWREYLKLVPAEPHARNNLSYVLLLEGNPAQLAEAQQLSSAAIASDPDVSTFYDTLARIQLRLGKPDDAVKNFRAALDHSPSNVEAMIGLADVLESQPASREEARSLLLRIEAAGQTGPPLAPPLKKQLDHVKSSLSSSL